MRNVVERAGESVVNLGRWKVSPIQKFLQVLKARRYREIQIYSIYCYDTFRIAQLRSSTLICNGGSVQNFNSVSKLIMQKSYLFRPV
jgi:hypothetical protein